MIDHASGMLEIKRLYEKTQADLEASQSCTNGARGRAYLMAREHLESLIVAAMETRHWLAIAAAQERDP